MRLPEELPEVREVDAEPDELPELERLLDELPDEPPELVTLPEVPRELRELDTLPVWLPEMAEPETDPEDTTLVDFGEALTELAEAGDAEEDPLERASELTTVVTEAVEVM